MLTYGAISKGVPTTVTLSKSDLFSIVSPLDAYFAVQENVKDAIFVYESNQGNQKEMLKFHLNQETPTATFLVSEKSRSIFVLKMIVLIDFDDGYLTILRSQLSAGVLSSIGSITVGEELNFQIFETAGIHQWLCPPGVTSVHAVCVGGGGSGGAAYWAGGGGGGGGLGWKNNITVVPGQTYTVVVGAGGVGISAADGGQGTNGQDSYFIQPTLVKGGGGAAGVGTSSLSNGQYAGGAGGSFVGDGGGSGGAGEASYSDNAGGGGGAGGYTGNGGNGGFNFQPSGGGGAGGASSARNGLDGATQSGGGVGLLGQGQSGQLQGKGGSGGQDGSPIGTVGGSSNTGGKFGGGGGGQSNDSRTTPGCDGGSGGVAIVWPTSVYQFPMLNK